jgi:hypothetical protein
MQCKTKQSKAMQNKAMQNKTKHYKTKQCIEKQNKAIQNNNSILTFALHGLVDPLDQVYRCLGLCANVFANLLLALRTLEHLIQC